MTRDPGGWRAQYPGTCAICHEPFERNTLIVKKSGHPCHVECFNREHE